MLNGLDLFSGIGGITLALYQWVRPIAYCENDRFAQSVLLSRMANNELPIAPIWDDICTLNGGLLGGLMREIDIIYGGFPCQDISIAGFGAGLEGKRSGLVKEIYRLTSELKPRFVFLENVPAITARGGSEVVREFTTMGYDCRWCITHSGHTKKGFKGERWFFLAKAQSQRCKKLSSYRGEEEQPRPSNYRSYEGVVITKPEVKPELCRTIDGIPHRTHRIKSLGNAVVPMQAKKAFEILIGVNKL